MDPQRNTMRFSFGRQSSLDPIRRNEVIEEPLTVPENLDATMQLLFLACKGDVKGVEDLLDEGTDVNSIDLDGRTALHIAACEGNTEVVKLLLSRKANIDARDRWGSTVYILYINSRYSLLYTTTIHSCLGFGNVSCADVHHINAFHFFCSSF